MKGIRRLFPLSAIGLLIAFSPSIYASGFRLEMQSASVLADSGDAAVVEDAGTNWYNSAGLVDLPHQVVGSAIDVYAHTTYRGSVMAPNLYTGILPPAAAPDFFGSGKATAHSNSILPALHYNYPFQVKAHQMAFGLSVVPAWGLLEDFGTTAFTRYNLTRVYTRTLDVAPSLAFKINSHWSVGAGPDFHYFSLSQTNRANTTNLAEQPGAIGDSVSRSTGNSWNYGGHIGVLYRIDDATRVGINYRSKIVQTISGYSDFNYSGGGPFFSNSNFQLRIVLPPTTTISAYRDLNPYWAIMGTVAFDQWTVDRNLNARNYQMADGSRLNVVLPKGMHNTFDLSFGVHYILNEMWMFRANVKYLPTPTIDKYRDLNFPDADKLGFQIGARTHLSKKLALDMVYGHVFTRQARVNNTNTVTGVVTSGHLNTSMDLVGMQLVYDV